MTVLQWPDKTLRQKSEPVTDIERRLATIEEMYLLVKAKKARGLAAVQIGILERLCLVQYGDDYLCLINPTITKASEKTSWMLEGCLSLQEGKVLVRVQRHRRVRVGYTDMAGQPRTVRGTGLQAAILQHEIDHLDGMTIMVKGGGQVITPPPRPTKAEMQHWADGRRPNRRTRRH